MNVLVCAATSVEARACRAGIARAGCADRIEVLQTGIGRNAATKALRARISASRASTPLTPNPLPAGEGAAETHSEEEEDDWEPGPSNIPFGPWLSLAALELLLFGPWISAHLPLGVGWMITGS